MLNASLKAELISLSLPDKLEVFEAIRASVMPASERDFSELSPAQERELLRRAERAAAHPDEGLAWSEVERSLEAK